MRSRTQREGSVGLLIIFGILLFGGVILWIKGFAFGKESYKIVADFPDVNGIQEGDGVRYRGLQVGRVEEVQPSTNGVDVVVEIDSSELLIPKDATLKARSSGLIGETFIEIVPQSELLIETDNLSPIGSDCNSEQIVCDNARLEGEKGITLDDLLPYTYRFSRAYGEPEFVDQVDSALGNAAVAADEIAALTRDTSALVKDLQQEVSNISTVTQTVTDVANDTSTELVATAQTYRETAQQISRLASNVEELIDQNENNLTSTLSSIKTTSDRLSGLVTKIDRSVDATDTEQLANNLAELTTNAVVASQNLKNISESFGSQESLVNLQQTLDSARVTFDNAQKITSDLESITGDPTFLKNVRELVNGLSNLVSTTEQLEQQIKTGRAIAPIQDALSVSPNTSQSAK
ncbi:MCE family protein [Pleurocapsales cyanobacterium LEGE 10410]|nr:MCE family protein [Pleurocapsales cyanobacterium LEGE 10410]